MKKEKFYITTAIAYASRTPHIGNIYEIILADCIARYKRMRGYDVFFMTGTDEHGQKIQDCAAEKGVSPQQYVDGVASEIQGIWDRFDISYDRFYRTTDEYHVKQIQQIFKKLYKQGDIYKSSYEGNYCKPCESFWTDTQLVDGCCPDCGSKCTREKEEAYFLKLSNYTDRLVEYMESHPDFIVPASRKNEMINNFIKPGLQDLCVSRTSFNWGIPVDFDDKHVVYVWLDALCNYITGIGYDENNPTEQYKKLWPADLHVIGKDIVRFHTIYWPIILMAIGEPLPKTVLGHPWLLFGNDKMSKSKGNVIYGDELIQQFGVSAVRHYMLSEMSFYNDGSITYESLIKRTNADLANTLGNLVSRTAGMIKQYFGGTVPAPAESAGQPDTVLKNAVTNGVKEVFMLMDSYHVAEASERIFTILKACNKYVDETTPWVLAKDEAKRGVLATVMANLTEGIRVCSMLLAPFIPEAARRISDIYGFTVGEDSFDFDGEFKYTCSGNTVAESPVLFARIDEKKFFASANVKTAETVKQPKKKNEEPKIEEIAIDDFAKINLRVGRILTCEQVENSDKLLKMTVDVGTDKRQIVSGIAKHYTSEQLINKKVIVVENLKPAVLRGEESKGMILASDCGKEVKVAFVDDSVPVGSRVR